MMKIKKLMKVLMIGIMVAGGYAIEQPVSVTEAYTANQYYSLSNTKATKAYPTAVDAGLVRIQEAQGVCIEHIILSSKSYVVDAGGTYYIELSGGGYIYGDTWNSPANIQSGYVGGAVELTAGDIINIVYLPGGSGNGKVGTLDGRAGLALEVNGKLVMGAGGAGGPYSTSDGLGGGTTTDTDFATNGQPLSGGAGGARDTYRDDPNKIRYGQDGVGYYKDSFAKAYNGTYTSPLVGKYHGEPGGNYIDTSMVTSYVSEKAETTAVSMAAEYSPKHLATFIWGTRPPLFKITKTTQGQAGGTGQSKVHIAVSQNQPYSCHVIADTDKLIEGTYGNISLKKKDEQLIEISGIENSIGIKEYTAGELVVYVTVMEEPDSSNINVILN